MQAYTDRFEYLARFYSPVVIEEWRCKKYEGGLKHELRRFIVPLRIREFPILVELAKVVEQLETGPSSGTRPQTRPISDSRRSHIPDHCLLPENCSVSTVVVST